MMKATFLKKSGETGLTVQATRFQFRGIQMLAVTADGSTNMVAWMALSGDWMGCDGREYSELVIEEV